MKIIAHRGANKLAPQNTLSAFRKAREMKVDGFETDVHFTKDGKVVICHNPDIDETSNGSGFINDLTYEQLLEFDFGVGFGEAFQGEKIPLLTEFLDVAAGLDMINIEIKTPHNHDYSIVDETLRLVREKGLTSSLLISSFDPAALRRAKHLAPEVKTGLLYDFTKKVFWDIIRDPVQYALRLGCQALHPLQYLIDKKTVAQAHREGLQVNCWTVDSPAMAKILQANGADGLITNVPDRLESFRS